ncbi:MAG: protein kinase [Anaerolineae bacterium]|nr:protein kinase [Anaerolineae bacterium]
MAQRIMVDHYEVTSEIGRGTMSVVYRADDLRNDRPVALKLLPRELYADIAVRTRFEQVAQALTTIEHPAIVPVYSFGEFNNQPYLVMPYMEGAPFACQLELGPFSINEAVGYIERLAPALQFAHDAGLIHRNIKPSNVLFDDEGSPYLSDFGLIAFGRPFAQISGHIVVGTPEYIAPELAEPGTTSPLADIYALGVLLYRMLSGHLPYDGHSAIEIFRGHIEKPVPNLRTDRPDLPEAVQQVLLGAMAKDPSDRYQSPMEMQENLLNMMSRIGMTASEAGAIPVYIQPSRLEPTTAQEPTFGQYDTIPEWYEEEMSTTRDIQVGLTSSQPDRAPTIPRGVGEAPAAEPSLEPRRRRRRSDERRAIGNWRAAQARRAGANEFFVRLAGFTMPPALALSMVGVMLAVMAIWFRITFQPYWDDIKIWLGMATPPPDIEESLADAYPTPVPVPTVLPTAVPFLQAVQAHSGPVTALAYDPVGGRVASSGEDHQIILWKTGADGISQSLTLTGHRSGVTDLSFSPDGSQLASVGIRGTVRIWDTATGTALLALGGEFNQQVNAVAWSADGRYLVAGGNEGLLVAWDVTSLTDYERVLYQPLNRGPIEALAFNGNTTLLVGVGYLEDNHLLTMDITRGTISREVLIDSAIHDLALNPDGDTLYISTDSGLRAIDPASGAPAAGEIDDRAFTDSAVAPDGLIVAGATGETSTSLWELASGMRIRQYPQETISAAASGGDQPVTAAVVTAVVWTDDDQLVTGWSDGVVTAWDLLSTAYGPPAGVVEAEIDASTAALIEEPVLRLGGLSYPVQSLGFSPDGSLLVAGSQGGRLLMWDTETGQPYPTLVEANVRMNGAAFHPSGGWLVSVSEDGYGIDIRDVLSGDVLVTQPVDEGFEIDSVTWSSDGKLLAVGLRSNTVFRDDPFCKENPNCLCDESGLVCPEGSEPTSDSLCQETPDCYCLGVDRYCDQGRVLFWQWDGAALSDPQHLQASNAGAVADVVISPDRTAAAAAFDGLYRELVIWSLESGEVTGMLQADYTVGGLAWSDSGLAVAHGTGLDIINMETGDLVKQIPAGEENGFRSAAWNPSGELLAGGMIGGEVMIVDAQGEEITTLSLPDDEYQGPVDRLAFSPDGRLLAAGMDNGMVVLWGVVE